MRFSFATVITCLLVGSVVALPTGSSPPPPAEGVTDARTGTVQTQNGPEKGVIKSEGDNIPFTAENIAKAKEANPELNETRQQSDSNRADVKKKHKQDPGSPVGPGPHSMDEFPTNRESVDGLTKSEQIDKTRDQDLPQKEQGGVKNDQADPNKGLPQQGALEAKGKALAKEIAPSTDGAGVPTRHEDNRTVGQKSKAVDGPAAAAGTRKTKKPKKQRSVPVVFLA